MAKYNGSGILLYADGVEIAAQKGFSLNLNVNLFDITTKNSSGWAEHDKGLRSSDVSFDALQSTTGVSAVALFDYINLRKSLMLVVTGLTYPIIGEVDCTSMTINAPTEDAVGLSGSFKVKGRLFRLGPTTPNLITDPDGGGTDFDTLTIVGIAVTAAVNNADSAYFATNSFAGGAIAQTYKFITFLDWSGQLPTAKLIASGGADASNVVQMVNGLNVITFVTTGAPNALYISNTQASAGNTKNLYLMKL